MADIQQILGYLGKHCNFTTLPTYKQLLDGLKVDESVRGIEAQFIVPMIVPERLKEKKLNQVKRIASHLWGGNEEIKRVFNKITGVSIHSLNYATTSPLRVRVSFSDELERTFYAKELDEKRLFGIELENMLSPYKYEYSASGGGIYEDEIRGVEQYSISEKIEQDPLYLEELVKLDYRAFVMLLGDLNPKINPHNCLVVREMNGDNYSYRVRPIDFDNLFEIEDFENDLVLSGQRDKVINSIGSEKYHLLRSLEKESLRKRYLQNSDRLNELIDIVGSSDTCNKGTARLGALLDRLYRDPRANFRNTKNMGELLSRHIRLQLDSK